MRVTRFSAGLLALVVALQAGSRAQQRVAGVQDASWAPDGRSLLFYDLQRSTLILVDAETGVPTELPWQVGYDPDWQRLPRP